MAESCRVCNAAAHAFAHATILGKHEIEYQRCSDCQFIQTQQPFWLEEAYSDAIISTDVGLVHRNQSFSKIASRLLRFVFPDATSGIDYGGGYGMFTRMMRDLGHRFVHYDPYCQNLFAKGLEAQLDGQRHDLLTAFEVWEHMAQPHQDIAKMDAMADHWLVSTMLVPEPTPAPDQWWYYALEGGQHVALWSKRALQAVASNYGRHLITTRKGVHLFSRRSVNRLAAAQILSGRCGFVLDRLRRRKSLLQADYQAALAGMNQKPSAPAAA
ncbi:MAG: class I SAM-dependent methyltransferase [Pirellulales bacterium]|nr:class I SAM-dependent methyltransferase [Pirellulales bacterium]